jgi:hypothetical protein
MVSFVVDTEIGESFVDHDLSDPEFQRTGSFKFTNMRKNLHKPLYHNVFRLVFGDRIAHTYGQHLRGESIVQFLLAFSVVMQTAINQVCIVVRSFHTDKTL